jgi:hypothetical protein
MLLRFCKQAFTYFVFRLEALIISYQHIRSCRAIQRQNGLIATISARCLLHYIVTKKAFEKVFETLSDTKNVITRSNDHFEWPSSAGIMMFDYDPDGEPLSQTAVLDLLYQASF